LRTDDADQLSDWIWVAQEHGVNACCECLRIRVITSANDDSWVSPLGLLVETDEVETVQGDCNAILFGGVGQNLLVGNLLIRASGFLGSENIVSEVPQLQDDPVGEVLVGVEQGHQAS
jgi:hypothetical protein